LEEMHWEVLPGGLAPSNFHLFGTVKEVLRGKTFTADDEVKLFVQRWLDEQPQTFLERGIMKVPEREYVEKQSLHVKKSDNFL